MKIDLSTLRQSPRADGLAWHSTLAILSGLLLLLSFPNFGIHYLAWVALVPLLYVLGSGVTLRRAFWAGWLTGLVWIFFAENWIAHSMIFFGSVMTVVAYGVAFLFAVILALFPALFGLATAWLARVFGWPAFGAAPFIWVASEWLRQMVTGVTWNALGISQVPSYRVARLAQYGGVYLVSAEVVAASVIVLLVPRIKDRATGRMAILVTITALTLVLFPSTTEPFKGATGALVSVAGIQPNLPPDSGTGPDSLSYDLERNISLTKEAIERTPEKAVDLAIWAESPLTLFYENDPGLKKRIDDFAKETGSHLVINTVARDSANYFNSINIVDPRPDDRLAVLRPALKRYDKMRLVPFGEYVPYRSILGRFVPSITGDFTAGKENVVNLLRLETKRAALLKAAGGTLDPSIERTTNFIRLGGFICYEAAYPDLVRGFVMHGATLLVNLSNDAWFGNTAGARQHLAHARMRAIETDRDLIRVTNSGISALITAEGEVVDELPPFVAGSQVWHAHARRNLTPYVKHGDWFAISSLTLSGLLLLISILYRRRR